MNPSFHHLFNIVLVGIENVGKTSLLSMFTRKTFDSGYLSTIGISFETHIVQLDGVNIKLHIWDTGGERFKSITEAYYRGASGILLLFDVTDYHSFSRLLILK